MRIEIDGTFLVVEPGPGVLRVEVPKNGYDGFCLDVISRYVDAEETDTGLSLAYVLDDGEVTFRDAVDFALTRLERLALAQKLEGFLAYRGGFVVPVVHPDNVYLSGDQLRVVHAGLAGILAPRVFDEAHFFASVRAMVLQVFYPKMLFEQLLHGANGLRDKFSARLLQAATPEDLFAFIGAELQIEQSEARAMKIHVSKRRYSWYRVLGGVGVVAALGAGGFAWQAVTQNTMNTAVIASQARFLSSDYAGALNELKSFSVVSLPTSAQYVLAVSSINLGDLTSVQKQAILNNISQKSDEVTLRFWIASGRGEFEQALDFAMNLGDEQLILLAYTDLYQATKLDTMMPGEKKQERLAEYAKAIDELTLKLQGATASETGESGADTGEAATK